MKEPTIDILKTEAIPLAGDVWQLHFLPLLGVDYRAGQRAIWSIGRHRESGGIHASLDGRFYEHPDYECLWLR